MKRTFRFELLMDAGNGAQKAGDILIKALARKGLYVFIEPIIPAEISPPKRTPYSLSGTVIRVSNQELSNIGSSSDLILVEHDILCKRRLSDKEYSSGCTVFMDTGYQKKGPAGYEEIEQICKDEQLLLSCFAMSPETELLIKELHGNGKNMYYLGMLTWLFNASKDVVETLIRETFKKLPKDLLEKNINIYENGFNAGFLVFEKQVLIESKDPSSTEQILVDGNTALSLGIIDSGIRFFSGYPITPASSIMHNLAKFFPSYGGILHQAEDEISAIGAVLGSYFAGVPAVTATSGPGLSLKQEFLGLALASEIPCILIDVQRGGPSTGLPTRTEQTDIFASAFGSHGDGPKVVISVANVEDCFYVPHIARYLTEVLRVPVIILSDYMISVSYRVLNKFQLTKMTNHLDIPDSILENFYMNRLDESAVEMVKENQSLPGEEGLMRRVTGLNTDQKGQVEYHPDINHRSHKVRNEKIHHVRRALKMPEIMGDDNGDLLIVGWGSSRGAIEESVLSLREKGMNVSGMHFKMVYPLPLMLRDAFMRFKRIVSVEMAYGDELKPTDFAILLRSETLCDVQPLVSDATGRPLKPSELIEKSLMILSEVVV